MNIIENKINFLNNMIELKNQISNELNKSFVSNDIDKLRIGYEGKFSKERFKECLVKKITLHIVFKYIFIRMMSESQKVVSPKLDEEGISNWNEMSKNYRTDYFMLFNIACDDLRRNEQTREFFEPCIYDNYLEKIKLTIFNSNNNNLIEKLKHYDFKTLDSSTAASLFDRLYPNEDKNILQGFLEDSKITTYLMKSLGLI